MALDFPNSPTAGQLFVAPNGVTYQWASTPSPGLWLPLAVTSAGVGDFYANVNATGWPASATTVTNFVVQSGNNGGWFVPATGRFTPPAGRYYLFSGGTTGHASSACSALIA